MTKWQPKVTPNLEDFKRDMLAKYPQCQVMLNVKGRPLQCGNPSEHLHHALVSKDKRFKKDIDKPVNFQPACGKCNVGRFADTQLNKEHWMRHQVAELGYSDVYEYIEGLPDKKYYLKGELRLMLGRLTRPVEATDDK